MENNSDAEKAMEKPLPEYPTDQQLEGCFAAHKRGGEKGILEFLKKQRAEREETGNTSGAAESELRPGDSMEKL